MGQQQEHLIPKSVLVVDDDQLITALTKKILIELGVEVVDCFSEGNDAWEALSQRSYDFICLDWKLPGLSGLALFNRLRSSATYASTPILVISGFLQRGDFKILSEFSCSSLLEKPFAKPQFEHHFYKLLELKTWREIELRRMEEVMAHFKSDRKKAMKLLRTVIQESPDPMLQVVNAARAMRARGLYQDAEAVLRQALDKDSQAVSVLTELGKVLHLMKRHKDAARALNAANFISPKNIERLLLMGEVKLHELEPDEAKKYFKDVLGIDATNEKAKAGVFSAESMESFSIDPSVRNVPQNFASLLNIVAIAKVRSGKIGEGVEQYKAALSFLHDQKTLAQVLFNLGLAYLRDRNLPQARYWFLKSAEAGGKLFDKAKHYVRKLDEMSIVENNSFEFGKVEVSTSAEVNRNDLGDATSSDAMPQPSNDKKLLADNVEFMEERDFIEANLNSAQPQGEVEGPEMEDAVSYI